MSKAAELARFIGDGTLGLGGEEDKKLVFDGNAQDFHIGLDDSTDSLTIGLGSTLGTNSHMVIDANGHITKPLQPAFQVHPSGTVSDLSINNTHAIAFGTERFDNNQDFASDTFTAPVTGKYQLNLIMYVRDMPYDANYVETYIITSNRTYYLIVDPSSFDQVQSYYTFDAGVLADMDANDTCVIKVRQSGGTQQMDVSTASNFSGYLVA
tara:strand:+ start:38 stop:667 length:630 start_codon:yes stop_codon:yes gene_type:complete